MAKRDAQLSMAQARLAVERTYGEGAVVSLTGNYVMVKAVSSGSFLLDHAIGVGGFPRGRITELYGPPASGKSTLCMSAARNAQDQGLAVLYLDFEHSFDLEYGKRLGIDTSPDLFVLSQPTTLEAGMQILEFYLKNSLIGLVIVDSVAAMVTVKELEGDIGDTVPMALQARQMSQVLKRLTAAIDRSDAAVLFINHEREVIGGYNPSGRKRITTPGGSALKFYSSIRVELAVIGSVKARRDNLITGKPEERNVAVKVRAKVVKNKLGPPYKEAFFFLDEERGLNDARTVLDVAVARGIVKQTGSRLLFPFKDAAGNPTNIGGTDKAIVWLETHPKSAVKLRGRVLSLLGTQLSLVKPSDPDAADIADGQDGAEEVEVPEQVTFTSDAPGSGGEVSFGVPLDQEFDPDTALPEIRPSDEATTEELDAVEDSG